MNDRKLQSLLQMAAEAASMDDARPVARGARGCLSMARLQQIASRPDDLTALESGHLSVCRTCSLRLLAFGPIEPVRVATGRGELPWAWGIAGLAAAAALLIGLLWPLGGPEREFAGRSRQPDRTKHVVSAQPAKPVAAPELLIPDPAARLAVNEPARLPMISVAYSPGVHREPGGQIDCLSPVVDRPATVVALLRVWDETCNCVRWQLHQWDDGNVKRCVDPGYAPDVPVRRTNTPFDPLVVFAVSHEGDSLPNGGEEANDLLSCLNANEPNADAARDTAMVADTAQSCLGQNVSVFAQRF